MWSTTDAFFPWLLTRGVLLFQARTRSSSEWTSPPTSPRWPMKIEALCEVLRWFSGPSPTVLGIWNGSHQRDFKNAKRTSKKRQMWKTSFLKYCVVIDQLKQVHWKDFKRIPKRFKRLLYYTDYEANYCYVNQCKLTIGQHSQYCKSKIFYFLPQCWTEVFRVLETKSKNNKRYPKKKYPDEITYKVTR